MADNTTFSVFTPSRHPLFQRGYDSLLHRYRNEYVNPTSWDIHIIFLPEGVIEKNEKLTIPDRFRSIKWTVSKSGMEDIIIEKKTLSSMPRTIIKVPEQGIYTITLQVKLMDGTSESKTSDFNLRDFLVVSIGDSFASGQGNPDSSAIPSSDQKITCKATSVKMIVSSIMPKIIEFSERGVLDLGNKLIIKNLPIVGTAVNRVVSSTLDVTTGTVNRQIKIIKDTSVNFFRKTVHFLQESVEEFLGKFGIGDGGEFDSPRPAVWQEPLAYRSYRSGHSLAVRKIELNSQNRITFLSFARSGAEIVDGLLTRTLDFVELTAKGIKLEEWIGNKGQVQEAEETIRNRQIDALIVTVSVNDIGFSGLTKKGILKADGADRTRRIAGAKRRIEEDLPRNMKLLKDEIDKRLQPKKVLITEYPVGVFKEIHDKNIPDNGPCGVLVSELFGFGLNGTEANDLTNLGMLLNQKIRELASNFGWILVDGIEAGFDGHGYCANSSFFVSAEESCLNQGDFEGMLHPNAKGHELARDRIAEVLTREVMNPVIWMDPILNVMMNDLE